MDQTWRGRRGRFWPMISPLFQGRVDEAWASVAISSHPVRSDTAAAPWMLEAITALQAVCFGVAEPFSRSY